MLDREKLKELYKFAKENDCRIVKECGKNDMLIFKFDAQLLADDIQDFASKHIRVDQAKNRVVFDVELGERVTILQEIAGPDDEFDVEPRKAPEIELNDEEDE